MKTEKKKILLIDDDAIVNATNKILIESIGDFDVQMKSNPEEGIEFMESIVEKKDTFPSIIMVDISMPEIDGFEFIDLLEDLFDNNDVENIPAIVLLSGSKYKRDFEKFDKMPLIKKFLSKPLEKDEVIELFKEFEML